MAQPTNALKTRPSALEAPVPVPARCPVDFFRELLAMSFSERIKALADRPPETRKLILAKLREYESMKSSDREPRLRATELRWYLLPLMRTPATNRTEQLSLVPAELQPLIDTRLKQWDLLPPEIQKDFLRREPALRAYTQIQTSPNQAVAPTNISPNLQKQVRDLLEMSPEQREDLVAKYELFMRLSEQEQAKTLQTISEADRAQIEKTLQKFKNLTPEQQAICVHSFVQFRKLSREERQEFLKNAAKWTRMNPDERKQWQELVDRSQLLPPWITPLPPPPPLPRRVAQPGMQQSSRHNYATNN